MKNLKSIFTVLPVILFAGIIMVSCKPKTGTTESTEQTEATDSTVEQGWITLFDGSSTDGWIGYNKDAFPATGWVIEDGA
ncbi:MAG: DUF1080 domain-containing protein, partial [Bacteroidales bacterium]|nr:DUF1080 domain-containing protein [Bacteroidales bacterium]